MAERPSPTAALTAFFIGFVSLTVLSLVAPFLSRLGLPPGALYAIEILFQALAFAAPVFSYYRRCPQHKPALRLEPMDPLLIVLTVLAALAFTMAGSWISSFWNAALREIGLVTDTGGGGLPRNTVQLWMALAASAFAPALFEELLFRGMMLPALESMGRKAAIFISGMLFALMHARVEAFPSHILAGMVLALLVLDTGSLYTAMLYHAIYNGSILVISYVVSLMPPRAVAAASPTLADMAADVPYGLFWVLIWILLLRTTLRHGAARQANPLPPALRSRLTRPAKALLCTAFACLIAIEFLSLWAMIPGGGA